MTPDKEAIEQKVLASLNCRTLVNGATVPTEPIARDVGISVTQLQHALSALLQRGYITGDGANSSITPDGHAWLS
jgi:DNA-binding GntR family transcriptional regulator